MTGIAAIAWDIDGTLIDSEPLHMEVLTLVCERHGFDVRIIPDDAFRGVHLPDVYAMLAPRLRDKPSREAWIEEIIDVYVARAASLVPLPGALQAIGAFAALGLRQVCVSNSNRRIVDANIAALGIAATIEFSISLDDVTAGKPDPEPYRFACDRLGLDPAKVAAVEDSRTGATSARAAGLLVVGYGPASATPWDVDVTVEALDALPKCLLRMNDRGPEPQVGG